VAVIFNQWGVKSSQPPDKSNAGWLNLSHSPTPPLPVIAKHRVVKFQDISRSKGQDGCGGKDFEKVEKRDFKRTD